MSQLSRNPPRKFITLFALMIGAWLFGSCAHRSSDGAVSPPASRLPAPDTVEADRLLQQAAVEALGDLEGAVLVMDPSNGRLRAVVNPRLAFEQAFPPGSTLKTFTALTALRLGVIDDKKRMLCPGRYTRGSLNIVCSHPKSKTPFNVVEALAYSCNFYFATVAERLSASAFASTLASFRFGERTGANAGGESAGSVRAGEWKIHDALGEGEGLLATPIQVLAAYVTLFNGGHAYRPRQGKAQGFVAEERASVDIEPSTVPTLMAGCRGAVEYGTAAKAGLAELPMYIFGKTGTSTDSNGFRRQGWFVGFAAGAPQARVSSARGATESPRLAVLVFARRSHGSECAEVARKVFEAYSSFEDRESKVAEENTADSGSRNSQFEISSLLLRVRLVREGKTEEVPLEDYVVGVMSMEASTEDELEALKAQAVVSRTFAMKNLGRHASEGYDLCSNTHCQQYSNDRLRVREALRRAVDDTAGRLLREGNGQPIDAYFHAACGGATANIESLWGVAAPGYLRGVRDDFCAPTPDRRWVDEIPSDRLAKALAADPRSDPGKRLNELVVTRRDAGGRAELITIEGERRKQVRGWEFKMIVGRALGWNVLKSSRFEVSRRGSSFVFRGSGFGHGLGLCQQGAHIMARRGAAYQHILEHYFPGIASSGETAQKFRRVDAGSSDELTLRSVSWQPRYMQHPVALYRARVETNRRRLTLSGEHFRISYPASVDLREIESAMRILEAAQADIARRLIAASMTAPVGSPLQVTIHDTTQSFTAATGQPWYSAGATRGRQVQLQPLAVLRRRGILASTLRHEYAHAVIEALGQSRTPRWLTEGLAIHFAGEGPMLRRFEGKNRLSLNELEAKLAQPASAAEMRSVYAAAHREVLALIQSRGEARVWELVKPNI